MVTSWILALFASLAGVSGTVGATTLTVAQLAKHGHSLMTSRWGHQTSGAYKYPVLSTDPVLGADVPANPQPANAGSSSSHTHSLSGVKSGAASSLPPYYALAYIMRVA